MLRGEGTFKVTNAGSDDYIQEVNSGWHESASGLHLCFMPLKEYLTNVGVFVTPQK